MSEQQLNSLDRFRKKPERLVLEEHSHCEVPAGCGGVVLRWRNPHAAVPLRVHFYSPARAALFLDNAPLSSGRPELSPGEHLLALALEEIDLSSGIFLFVARHDPQTSRGHTPSSVQETPQKVLGVGDGSWRFTLEEP